MDTQSALRSAIKHLRLHDIPSAALDAELLLSEVTGIPRESLLIDPDRAIAKRDLGSFRKLIQRRARNVPLAYLVRNKSFYGMDFYVDERVPIPRPATERLFEETLSRFRSLGSRATTLVDVGTGSGCLAVLFAKYLTSVRIYAIDTSVQALCVSRKNARSHDVDDHITFLHGPLLKPLKQKRMNCIVANLPYLPQGVLGSTKRIRGVSDDAVRSTRYEPKAALMDASPDGCKLVRQLIEESVHTIDKPGIICLEIYPPSCSTIVKEALNHHSLASVDVIRDDAGDEHFVTIQL